MDANPAIALGWVDTLEVMDEGSLRSRISDVPVFRIWETETIHIGDSSIAPARTYAISVTADDVQAILKFITLPASNPSRPHMTWMDLVGQAPNWLVNATDLQLLLQGFKGDTYPPVAFEGPNAPPQCP